MRLYHRFQTKAWYLDGVYMKQTRMYISKEKEQIREDFGGGLIGLFAMNQYHPGREEMIAEVWECRIVARGNVCMCRV